MEEHGARVPSWCMQTWPPGHSSTLSTLRLILASDFLQIPWIYCLSNVWEVRGQAWEPGSCARLCGTRKMHEIQFLETWPLNSIVLHDLQVIQRLATAGWLHHPSSFPWHRAGHSRWRQRVNWKYRLKAPFLWFLFPWQWPILGSVWLTGETSWQMEWIRHETTIKKGGLVQRITDLLPT